MKPSIAASLRCLSLLAGLWPAFPAFAQSAEPEQLPVYVLTATRTPVALTTTGSSIDTVSAADLARMQLGSLQSALGGIPGAPAFQSGAPGGVTSLFLRGSNSNQALFLVDGIRFNDPNTDYAVALGGMSVSAGDSLEVLHGPQSTLYGAEAVGGVVAIRGQRGNGPAQGTVAVEAGSFGTVRGTLSTQGGDAQEGYAFSATGGHTGNVRVNNKFDSATYTLRLDRKISDTVAIGATWRGFIATYGDPGADVGYMLNDPDNQDRENNQLATVFADFGRGTALTSHVVLGGQDRKFVSDNPNPDPMLAQFTTVKNRRLVLDWQSSYTGIARHRLTGGFTGELNSTVNDGFGDINQHERLLALFMQDEWTPVQNLFLTAGLRSDDFDTFGRATTGRVTAAWLTDHDRLKFRASYGTGFRAPGFLDLYGRSTYYVGSFYDTPPRTLKPERARGWDAGVDYYLAGNRGMLSATFFRTDLDQLITFDFNVFPGTVRNVEQARTQGVELAGKFDLPGQWKLRAAYTYLEADNLAENSRLLRRPRHSGSLDLWHDFGGGFSSGAGMAFVGDRPDVDAASFDTITQPSYTVVRLYGAWQVNPRLTLKVRMENLLNEKYEAVNGYPQLGFGVFAGAELKF